MKKTPTFLHKYFCVLFLISCSSNDLFSSFQLENFSKRLGSSLYQHYVPALDRLTKKGIIPAIFEMPVPYAKVEARNTIINYPCIPSRNCTPWTAYIKQEIKRTDEKPIFNLRTRDFKTREEALAFIKPFANKVRVLLVYGDGKESGSNVSPSDLIQDIQALGIEVGVVVNPTPITRTPEAERTSFINKLSKKPNFVITQCFYDPEEARQFFQEVWKTIKRDENIKIYANLGFWKPNMPLEKLGIKAAGNFEPSNALLDFVKSDFFAGVSVCCFQGKKIIKE